MDARLRAQLRHVLGTSDVLALGRLARDLERSGELALAATAYDVAYGLEPQGETIGAARAKLLDRLSVSEDGITWRYVPAGTLRMGSEEGDDDERPVHQVDLDAFWIGDVPVSWELFARLAGWPLPPDCPEDGVGLQIPRASHWPGEEGKVRVPFCNDRFERRSDFWDYEESEEYEEGGVTYRQKPVVAVSWAAATALGQYMSSGLWTYRLPTEAEWEKAARGGLIGARYAWGDAPPTPELCDCDAPDRDGIRPSRSTPPNGYGLHAMCGGVWEWTGDRYDAAWYAESPRADVGGPEQGDERVIRGGSWADAAPACTVSFRASCPVGESSRRTAYMTPNLGFRLVRVPTDRAARAD